MPLQRMGLLSVLLLLVSSGSPLAVESPDGSSPGDISLGPISGMNFAHIPSGSFQMGPSDSDPDSYDNEHPIHTVTFDYSFEMMTTEVTQGMWEEVMGTQLQFQYQESLSESEDDYGLAGTGDDYPMYYVSLEDCQHFVDAMNALDPAHEYRLPSESEWEYCCRAGTTTRFYWGDDPGCTLIDSYAWYGENSGGETHPVGQKLPNAWGLYDMSGNVCEWCRDLYTSDCADCPANGNANAGQGVGCVGRGGGWYTTYAHICRSASRVYSPGLSDIGQGFRLARSAR